MPFVRIDLIKGQYTAEQRAAMADVVYEALLGVGALAGDRFQVIAGHADDELLYGDSYLGVTRTDGFVAIQITMNAGRTVDQKKQLYAAIADGLAEHIGTRREDVFINLIEVPKENWSFGNGRAQYADDD